MRQDNFLQTQDQAYLQTDINKLNFPRHPDPNNFASCIRVLDPYKMETVDIIELKNKEVVFS